ELLKNGESEFEIKLKLSRENIDEEIRINFNNEEKKKIKINEIPVKKIGDLMGHLNAVIFSPEDLFIIKQGPAERRRFIDITLSQLRPSYFYDLQQYARILFQRNNLLKRITVQRSLEDTLEVWDKHLVKTGSRIMKARRKFIGDLSLFASARHEKLTNNEEQLTLNYDPSFDVKDGGQDDETEKNFYSALEKNRDSEIRRGTTMSGPHRDDIDIILNGESTKIYGSQGQQRTSVLSMKLAEIDLIKEEIGDCPVLLLDDVLSELDDRRKEYLLESINGSQTFITCTEMNFYKGQNPAASIFHIDNGCILL
ncbi:MAG TPA: DNA replication/repair protein RecF, partial [Clostridia bacterium]|nr:DNA replication/repair protein RecF [Clostridia bacterium]